MIIKLKKLIDSSHRYLGLIIFIQVILWSFSGFFMYFLDFSDLYTNPPDKPINFNIPVTSINEIQQFIKKELPGENIYSITLKNIAETPYYNIRTEKQEFLIDQNLEIIKKIPEAIIKKVAQGKYTGNGKILKTELLNESKGNYFSSKPIYRITYDDQQQSEMYINPEMIFKFTSLS